MIKLLYLIYELVRAVWFTLFSPLPLILISTYLILGYGK
jgi:hypothetical protein